MPPDLRVHEVLRRTPIPDGDHALRDFDAQLMVGFLCVGGVVGRDDHVVEREQGIIWVRRLRLEHVQSGSRELSLFENLM